MLSFFSGDSAKLWVSVLGHVYDVSLGIRHYGNHGTYNFFTGLFLLFHLIIILTDSNCFTGSWYMYFEGNFLQVI